MSEPTQEEIEQLYGRVITVLDNKPGNLQWHVVANVIAALALASMDNQGADPYSTAREIYRASKKIIQVNLDSRGVLAKRPKGMRPN